MQQLKGIGEEGNRFVRVEWPEGNTEEGGDPPHAARSRRRLSSELPRDSVPCWSTH